MYLLSIYNLYLSSLSLSSIYLSSGICVVIYHLLCISLSSIHVHFWHRGGTQALVCARKPSDADPHSQSLPSVYYYYYYYGSYSPSRSWTLHALSPAATMDWLLLSFYLKGNWGTEGQITKPYNRELSRGLWLVLTLAVMTSLHGYLWPFPSLRVFPNHWLSQSIHILLVACLVWLSRLVMVYFCVFRRN